MQAKLETFLQSAEIFVFVTVEATQGSTPRNDDAWMLVSAQSQFGTIGGGSLEWTATTEARRLLTSDSPDGKTVQVVLGPETGQCCGGTVELVLTKMTTAEVEKATGQKFKTLPEQPHAYIFGHGHVGRELVQALRPLPLAVHVVDTRASALENLPGDVTKHLTPIPESVVNSAPENSIFVIMTHDHSLDFLVATAALNRGDATYVGMIGSATKRAVFTKHYSRYGSSENHLKNLVCPIAGGKSSNKSPAVIAALTAAEIVQYLAKNRQL